MEVDHRGTHITHCCLQHGCVYRYAGESCPVVDEGVDQEYPCEYCDDLMEDIDEKIKELEDHKKFMERFKK